MMTKDKFMELAKDELRDAFTKLVKDEFIDVIMELVKDAEVDEIMELLQGVQKEIEDPSSKTPLLNKKELQEFSERIERELASRNFLLS